MKCLVLALLLLATATATAVFAAEKKSSLDRFKPASATAANDPILDVPLKDIDGKDTSLAAYKGNVLLLVNVASKCGNTPQYADLQALHEKFKDQGLVVLGIPCNDFGAQEPGTNDQIKEFCSSKYKVTFPMLDKVHVKGPEQHPLYTALTGEKGAFPGDVKWNFGKFLIGRDGKPLQRIEPKTKVSDPAVVASIEDALKKK
jgi:glutathione peroxidase